MSTTIIGKIGWIDLTVKNADKIKDFYQAVTGWDTIGYPMNGYEDFVMKIPETGDAVAGICHPMGANSDLPPVWIIYIHVENLEKSIESCREMGGTTLSDIKKMGDEGRYCFIKDPAGTVSALYQSNS